MIAQNPDLMYPNQKQLRHIYDEGSSPHLYNYFCLHGNQIFLRKSRKVYSVVCRGWVPPKYVDEFKYSSGITDYTFFSSYKIADTMEKFNVCCSILLNSKYGSYYEKNPLVNPEITFEKEKELDTWLVYTPD